MVRATEAGSTRDRILQIALDLFGRQGYEGTSIRNIADRMGMTKAAIYYHFPSKENLLADILTPAMTRVGHVLATAGPVSTSEQRRALVTALVDVVGDVGPQVAVMLSDPAVGAHLRTNGRVGEHYRDLWADVADDIDQGGHECPPLL